MFLPCSGFVPEWRGYFPRGKVGDAGDRWQPLLQVVATITSSSRQKHSLHYSPGSSCTTDADGEHVKIGGAVCSVCGEEEEGGERTREQNDESRDLGPLNGRLQRARQGWLVGHRLSLVCLLETFVMCVHDKKN